MTGVAFDNRMTNKSARQPFAREVRRLERQQGQQMIEKARDLARAAGAPGPYRRRHIMDERNTFAFQPARDAKAKIRRIDGNERGGALAFYFSHRFTHAPQQMRHMA